MLLVLSQVRMLAAILGCSLHLLPSLYQFHSVPCSPVAPSLCTLPAHAPLPSGVPSPDSEDDSWTLEDGRNAMGMRFWRSGLPATVNPGHLQSHRTQHTCSVSARACLPGCLRSPGRVGGPSMRVHLASPLDTHNQPAYPRTPGRHHLRDLQGASSGNSSRPTSAKDSGYGPLLPGEGARAWPASWAHTHALNTCP